MQSERHRSAVVAVAAQAGAGIRAACGGRTTNLSRSWGGRALFFGGLARTRSFLSHQGYMGMRPRRLETIAFAATIAGAASHMILKRFEREIVNPSFSQDPRRRAPEQEEGRAD